MGRLAKGCSMTYMIEIKAIAKLYSVSHPSIRKVSIRSFNLLVFREAEIYFGPVGNQHPHSVNQNIPIALLAIRATTHGKFTIVRHRMTVTKLHLFSSKFEIKWKHKQENQSTIRQIIFGSIDLNVRHQNKHICAVVRMRINYLLFCEWILFLRLADSALIANLILKIRRFWMNLI